MPSPINNLGSALATQTASNKPAARVAEKGTQTAPQPESGGSDIGALRQAAMAGPGDFDREKVESIKQAIADGKYVIDSRRIAESFFSLERSLYGISSDSDQSK
jgi:negative regulator of flagellin synthesis FlgM